MKIALGAAKGLAFLHEQAKRPVIYRDFKTSNIFLDAEYNAKISDFGLARDGPEGDKTHISTRVMGTYGYAAPEYVMTVRMEDLPPLAEDGNTQSGVLMLNRWTYDDVQYHGGTNFGRTVGGPFITTSYDDDAPIDEYGYLKELHKAIKLSERAIVSAGPDFVSLGSFK